MTDVRLITVGTPPTFRQQVARALSLGLEDVEWVPTVAAAEDLLASPSDLGGVVVLSASVKDPDVLGLAHFVAENSPATAVVVVREGPPDGLLPLAMRAGIRDVVDLSRGTSELEDALHRAATWTLNLQQHQAEEGPRLPTQRGSVTSVFSSKGGTGKTFLACNLAVALAEGTGEDTAILDLDLGMGDVLAHFGLEAAKGLDDLLSLGPRDDRDLVRAAGTQLRDRLFGFAAPADPGAQAVAGETIGKLLRTLRAQFANVVVDTGGGYADHVLAALDVSDTICLITGLDVVSVRHLSVALDTLVSLGFPREKFRFVLNRADSKVGLGADEVEGVMELEVDVMIPSSRIVPTALNKGRPVVLEAPRSDVAVSIAGLADRIRGIEEPASRKRRRSARR